MSTEEYAQDLALGLHDAGHLRADGELVAAVEQTVRDVIRPVIGGDELDDLVQEALLRISIRFQRWNPDKGTFPAWAATVARNLAVDCVRRNKDAALALGEEVWSSSGDADYVLATVDDDDLIDSVIDRLMARRDTQALKVLAVIRDLVEAGQRPTHPAVATAAHVSESTVRRALGRIRAAVRELGGEM